MEAWRIWAQRKHPRQPTAPWALAFFALGLRSARISYDLGADHPHNFRFAVGLAFMSLLTLPSPSAAGIHPSA